MVVVLTTGGTISSRVDQQLGRRPALRGSELIASVADLPAVEVRVVDVLRRSSFSFSPTDMSSVHRAVREHLDDPDVCGVVVTHGTDTLEDTAYLLELCHDDPRPVVLTGAIRPADDVEPDGPVNLADSIRVAGSHDARHRGVLVVFAGHVLSAAGARKVDTTCAEAFDSPDFGAVGHVANGAPHFHTPPARSPRRARVIAPTDVAVDGSRVDIVAVYPGADAVTLTACVRAGAAGIVLEGTGSGNVTPAIAAAVRDLVATGVVVAISTRVHRGLVAPLYGGEGGGRELHRAGAVPTGWMRPSHARVALLLLLAIHSDPDDVRRALHSLGSTP